VDETILYLNARNPDMDRLAEPYTKPPYNVKVMGDSNNYGIATALNWMFGNATNEYVLFLEKDFRLVESLDCVMSQLAEGVKMLNVRPSL
jgi:GT2 family glycosyltransferase